MHLPWKAFVTRPTFPFLRDEVENPTRKKNAPFITSQPVTHKRDKGKKQ
jgi:hypothetical protein